jgi:hypothetical protein
MATRTEDEQSSNTKELEFERFRVLIEEGLSSGEGPSWTDLRVELSAKRSGGRAARGSSKKSGP